MQGVQSRKLNLGSGHDYREGYINVDLYERHKSDLVADITSLDMLPSGQFDEIVAQDVLEHLERSKVPLALKEWSRLLADNGTIRIRIPSLIHMVLHLCQPENQTIEKADEIMHMIFGTQAYSGDFHLSGFNPVILNARLGEVGLQICDAKILWGLVYEVVGRKCSTLTNPDKIVENAYFNVLHRPADASGLSHFSHELQTKRINVSNLWEQLKASEEFKLLKNRPSYLYNQT